MGCARSQFAAAALPISCAALVLVADPLVEWDGASTERAPARAAFVLASSPAVAIAADSGIDWQRSRWMYDGPGAGGSGLSVIGAYYPSRPASALAWGLAAAGVGFVALLVARPRVRIPG